MNGNVTPAQGHYQQRIADLGNHASILERWYNGVAWFRLVTALLALGLAIAGVWIPIGIWGWRVVGASASVFVGLVVAHAKIAKKRDRATAAIAFNERGLTRLGGKWTTFPESGAAYQDDSHPYALDLDIFGPSSLFQLLNNARTARGEQTLAAWLGQPTSASEIAARQAAVRDLAPRTSFREAIAVAASQAREANDLTPLVRWASEPLGRPLGKAVQGFGVVSTAVVVALVALASLQLVPEWSFLIPVVVNVLLLGSLRKHLELAIRAASSRAADLERYAEVVGLLEREPVKAPMLEEKKRFLVASGSAASVEIGRLASIVSLLDARHNGAFRFLIGPALLWDVHCVAALERWKARTGPRVEEWINVVGELEALASFAAFSYENPENAFPTVDEADAHFEAEHLAHPLLDSAVRVANDVQLRSPGAVLLVTGSNMSGKSTLLRSIGVAAVLAMCGAPVCARTLRMRACGVHTSMRVSDSLREGISRFYAELVKIKGVTDAAKQDKAILYLLDEILHGTNSRERHIGARGIIRALSSQGAIGAVSTHDLALADLGESLGEDLQTVHFQEHVVDGKMVFDYQLREGVVKSGNALRWMRELGLPTGAESDETQ